MPPKDMPKEVSIMGGSPVPSVPSPADFLAIGEATFNALQTRKSHQAGKGMARDKKGRLKRFLLRHLWGKTKSFGVCRPRLGSRHRGPFHYDAPARQPRRESEPCGVVPQMPPKEEKG